MNGYGTDSPILLVDDEDGIRKVLGISLKDMGYQVHTAENGEKAVEIVRSIRPPIVLTDIKMPGMSGIDLLCTIKKEFPDTEVIMITGHGDVELAIQSLKFEATDFITKPIHEDALEIALKRAQEKISMRRELRLYTQDLERLVEEKSARLLDAERMAAIGQTVAGLSHTIKDLAGGLKGGAYVLERGIENQNMEYLNQGWRMISGSVDKIASLSMDLLNYAKTMDLQVQLCHPSQPAEEVIRLMKVRADQEGIRIRYSPDESLAPFEFDPEAVHQCLFNLVRNAFDALKERPPDGTAKTVVIRSRARRNGGVEYQVEDNGCGMDDGTLQKIFKSFYTTKGSGGTGIGLMMVKNIVDQHQGEVKVRSRPGGGSCFTVRLPAEKGQARA